MARRLLALASLAGGLVIVPLVDLASDRRQRKP
jgi:hypothetical protein